MSSEICQDSWPKVFSAGPPRLPAGPAARPVLSVECSAGAVKAGGDDESGVEGGFQDEDPDILGVSLRRIARSATGWFGPMYARRTGGRRC